MRRNRAIRAFLPLAAGVLAVCPAWANCHANERDPVVKEEFHGSYSLLPRGTIRLEDEGRSLQIRTWDREEVRVDAVRTGSDQECVREAHIVVDQQHDRILISTMAPAKLDHGHHTCAGNVTVEFTLTIPRTAHLLVGRGDHPDEVVFEGAEII